MTEQKASEEREGRDKGRRWEADEEKERTVSTKEQEKGEEEEEEEEQQQRPEGNAKQRWRWKAEARREGAEASVAAAAARPRGRPRKQRALLPKPSSNTTLLARIQHLQSFQRCLIDTVQPSSDDLPLVATEKRSTPEDSAAAPSPPRRQRKRPTVSPSFSRLHPPDAAVHSTSTQHIDNGEPSYKEESIHSPFLHYMGGVIPLYAEAGPPLMPFYPPLMPPIPFPSTGSLVPWLVPPASCEETEQESSLAGEEDADTTLSESDNDSRSRNKLTKQKHPQAERRDVEKCCQAKQTSVGESCHTEQSPRGLGGAQAKRNQKQHSTYRKPKSIMKRLDAWDTVNTAIDCQLRQSPTAKGSSKGSILTASQRPCYEVENVFRSLKCQGSAAKSMDLGDKLS